MGNKKRILVVEKDTCAAAAAARLLEPVYEVELITDTDDPIRLLKSRASDFVLMDRSLLEEQLTRITQLQRDIIITMANLIEGRDGTTGEHIKRTSIYVELLVEKLLERGIYADVLTHRFASNLIQAAPMHDIGKITIPDRILQKPAQLTTDEFQRMKDHAAAGGVLLQENMNTIVDTEFLRIVVNVASFHHERWDGSGYPNGLAGEEIPLEARIMAVADVFDALVSKRQYKRAMPVDEALKTMRLERGAHFEPVLLDVFCGERDTLKEIVAGLEGDRKQL